MEDLQRDPSPSARGLAVAILERQLRLTDQLVAASQLCRGHIIDRVETTRLLFEREEPMGPLRAH